MDEKKIAVSKSKNGKIRVVMEFDYSPRVLDYPNCNSIEDVILHERERLDEEGADYFFEILEAADPEKVKITLRLVPEDAPPSAVQLCSMN